MREGTISARLYTAAYLAALTISNGWCLVNFDHDFEHFGAGQRLTLSSGGSSGQPTLIQLSDGLEFRILMQQRCPAKRAVAAIQASATESGWDALIREASSNKASAWSTHWIGRDCNCS